MNDFIVHVKPLIAEVPGWLTDEEGEALYDLARACTGIGVIVEERIYTLKVGKIPEQFKAYEQHGLAAQKRILGGLGPSLPVSGKPKSLVMWNLTTGKRTATSFEKNQPGGQEVGPYGPQPSGPGSVAGENAPGGGGGT